jgi:hypothetical protein
MLAAGVAALRHEFLHHRVVESHHLDAPANGPMTCEETKSGRRESTSQVKVQT